jgi:hypothetical protein
MAEVYEFFPDSVKSQIPKLYSQEGKKDPMVYMKLFTPWAGWSWFITEGEEQNGDFLMFGYVIGHAKEWGYSSLNELKEVTGPAGLKVERDIHFKPCNASEISDIKTHYKPKVENERVQTFFCETCDQDTPHEGSDCLVCGN